jgi:hypothetical protein
MHARHLGAPFVAALLCLSSPGKTAPTDEETAATMAAIVDALSIVLPLSFDEARFADPAHRQQIVAALRRLADEGQRLETHGQEQDAGFGFLSGSLSDDARDILARYESGRLAEARFLLHEITDNCIACHSRLPDARIRAIGRQLVDDPAVAALPLEERVRLEVATRQFDRALASYEKLFASGTLAPSDLDLQGYLDTYVELCLRVRQQPRRPLQTFEGLAARDDVSPPLRDTLAAWTASLRELKTRTPLQPPLVEARALMARARNRALFPDDRRALIYYVAASGLLNRYVAGPTPSRRDRAEAYYLLGRIESRVGRAFWLSQTEHHLDAAIRGAPGEPFADDAYALLEEFVASGYSGSAGGAVPENVQQRLAELRGLIEASRPGR